MTQPAPEYPDADVLSLEVDLAEVTAEVPALRLDEVREGWMARARPVLGEPYLGWLRQAVQVLRADVSADEMLRALFHDIREALGVDAYFNFMVNAAGDALALASCTGVTDDQARTFARVEFGQAVCGNVALKRARIVMTGIQGSSDRRVQIVKNLGIQAVACHPLLAGDRLLGTLSFASRTRDEFAAEALGFFGAIARAVALSHERSRLVRELAAVERELDGVGRSMDVAPSSVAAESAGAMLADASVAIEAAEAILTDAPVAIEPAEAVVTAAASAALLEAAPAEAVIEAADVAPLAAVEPAAEPEVTHVTEPVLTDAASAALLETAPVAAELAAADEVAPVAAAELATSDEVTSVASAELMTAGDVTSVAPADSPIESIEATPVGAEIILFARYAAAVAAVADIPLGLIEAAPVSALEVSPLTDIAPATVPALADEATSTASEATSTASLAESAIEARNDGDAPASVIEAPSAASVLEAATAASVLEAPSADSGLEAATAASVLEAPSAASVLDASSASPVADAAIEGSSADVALSALSDGASSGAAVDAPMSIAASDEEAPLSPIVEEMPRDEVLALALAATNAPTLEVLALALTVDDPAHHDAAAGDVSVESEITVELCALDLNTVRMPTVETPTLDLSANEISALDLRPVETVEAPLRETRPTAETPPVRETPRASAAAPAAVDDEAPTVEVKALAIQELEAERAPVDDGEDITFTYVPPT